MEYHLLCTKIGPNHRWSQSTRERGKGQSVGKVNQVPKHVILRSEMNRRAKSECIRCCASLYNKLIFLVQRNFENPKVLVMIQELLDHKYFLQFMYREDSLSMVPFSISSLMSLGDFPSTWQPTLKAVPSTSFTVPCKFFANDLKRIIRAILMISSSGIDLECLIFFSFFRSRGGSFRALMTREDAEGTTETAA